MRPRRASFRWSRGPRARAILTSSHSHVSTLSVGKSVRPVLIVILACACSASPPELVDGQAESLKLPAWYLVAAALTLSAAVLAYLRPKLEKRSAVAARVTPSVAMMLGVLSAAIGIISGRTNQSQSANMRQTIDDLTSDAILSEGNWFVHRTDAGHPVQLQLQLNRSKPAAPGPYFCKGRLIDWDPSAPGSLTGFQLFMSGFIDEYHWDISPDRTSATANIKSGATGPLLLTAEVEGGTADLLIECTHGFDRHKYPMVGGAHGP